MNKNDINYIVSSINKIKESLVNVEEEINECTTAVRLKQIETELDILKTKRINLRKFINYAESLGGEEPSKQTVNTMYLAHIDLEEEREDIDFLKDLVSSWLLDTLKKGETEDLCFEDSLALSRRFYESPVYSNCKSRYSYRKIISTETQRVIDNYIDFGELEEDKILFSVKDKVTKMLQESLNTDETDLKTLLEQYKNKISMKPVM